MKADACDEPQHGFEVLQTAEQFLQEQARVPRTGSRQATKLVNLTGEQAALGDRLCESDIASGRFYRLIST